MLPSGLWVWNSVVTLRQESVLAGSPAHTTNEAEIIKIKYKLLTNALNVFSYKYYKDGSQPW